MIPDVVVSGMGIVSPIGHGAESYWDALIHGRGAARPVQSFDTQHLPRHVACEIQSLPDLPPAWEAAGHGAGRCTRLVLAAALDALCDAGLDAAALAGRRVAVAVGTTMGETEFVESAYDDTRPDPDPRAAFARAAANRPGCLSDRLAQLLDAAGPNLDLYGACAAGNMALIHAALLLRTGRCDVVLAGGADAFSRFAFTGFMRNRVMAQDTCRPFDRRRDGLLIGEGAAMFVLERADTAIGRRRRARLGGGAIGCDAYNPTCPRPDGRSVVRVIESSIRESHLSPRDIQYVCAHGTGTPRNDDIEWAALNRCFPDGVAFSSIKALTGHTMGAAGALEAAACVLALAHQRPIPAWNLEAPCMDGPARPARCDDAAVPLRHVMNLSFGFGGYDSCLVLGRGDAE